MTGTFTATALGRTVGIPLGSGARVAHSLGVHLFPGEDETYAAVITNGWVNHEETIGGAFFDAIRIDCPFPVVGAWRVAHAFGSDGRIVIGSENGIPHNYFPPRGVHVVRFARATGNVEADIARIYNRPLRRGASPFVSTPNALAHLKATYDAYGDELLTCLRTGKANQPRDVWTNCLGPFHPLGITRGDRPGGEGIEGSPGWDRSSKYRLVSMDMRMDRTPIALIDSVTAQPIVAQRPGYDGYRTWNKSGVLPEFVLPRSPSIWDDERIAKDVNTGSCTYRGQLVPEQYIDPETQKPAWTYPYEADDVAHLVRATAHLKACRDLYRDEAAAFCLRMVAADAWMAWDPQPMVAHSGWRGPLRGSAWTLDALVAAGGLPQARLIARNLNAAQMPNGLWQRWPSSDPTGSPNPWEYGVDHAFDESHLLENAYTALAMELLGEHRSADAALRGMYAHGDPQWWQAVARNGTLLPVPEHPPSTQGWDKHQHWGALGVCARRDKRWIEQAKLLSAPDGGVLGEDVIGGLVRSGYYEGVAAMIESVEKWKPV